MCSMKPVFDIVDDPKGKTYIELLNFSASYCESFSLVWRNQFQFEQSAYEIKQALKPFLISNVRTDEWAGTKLIGHEAIVRRYRVATTSVKLLHTAGSLYSWAQPLFPEDLAFYASRDIVWLASISHDHKAWFLDELLSSTEIYANVPNIKIKAHKGF